MITTWTCLDVSPRFYHYNYFFEVWEICQEVFYHLPFSVHEYLCSVISPKFSSSCNGVGTCLDTLTHTHARYDAAAKLYEEAAALHNHVVLQNHGPSAQLIAHERRCEALAS